VILVRNLTDRIPVCGFVYAVTSILIADDHEVVREGLREILKEKPTNEVVAEVSDGKEAILKAVEIQPDIAVLADTLPLADGIDGIEATRQIHARLPKTKVLVFATHDNETLIEELLNAGARGYVRKSDAKRSLLGAIAALAANKRFSAPTVFLANGDRPQSPLTKRERVVIQLVAEGYSSKKIAKLLNITRRTVDTHRFNIRSKLNLFKIADLVRYAVRNKIVER
jgi:DNA-binding NarL/FixJ family response regulator